MDKEDAKSRGLKHRNSKRKYNKNKPAVSVPLSKPKVLDSNWDRYELKEELPLVTSSTDFSVLSNAPITYGSHFQFKSDKDVSEPVMSNLFNLDLTLLEKSLSTIPFSLRSGIDDSYFSESQRGLMTALADNIRDYQEYLQNHQSRDPDAIFGSESESGDSEGSEVVQSPQNSPPASPLVQGRPQGSDLEQWLDDILDD